MRTAETARALEIRPPEGRKVHFLGMFATFLFGGLQRTDRPLRTIVNHGDVCVWGGPSRLAFHGIGPIKEGEHSTGQSRVSLTFRKATN